MYLLKKVLHGPDFDFLHGLRSIHGPDLSLLVRFGQLGQNLIPTQGQYLNVDRYKATIIQVQFFYSVVGIMQIQNFNFFQNQKQRRQNKYLS